MLSALIAATLGVAAPATVTTEVPPPVAVTTEKPASSPKKPDFADMLRMMDKIFPPQPEPEPERLALSRVSVVGLLPDGTYARAMGGMMDSIATRVLDMSPSDIGVKGTDKKPASTETLHQKMLKDDPHFDERMAIVKRVVGEEMTRISAIIEPRLHEGLARSMARRFDGKQLADLNAFLATDSGKAYGRQSMAMWVDPDMMRSMMGAMPDLMMAMPGIAARIEKETAHLPKPKKGARTGDAKPKVKKD